MKSRSHIRRKLEDVSWSRGRMWMNVEVRGFGRQEGQLSYRGGSHVEFLPESN